MTKPESRISRRQALLAAGTAAAACVFAKDKLIAQVAPATTQATTAPLEPIIDIHQHTTYSGRSNEVLFHHQKRMGISKTILLPGGTPVITESTLKGKANGLYAGAGTTDTCIAIAKQYPGEYYFGANEVPDLPEAKQRIEAALKQGAVCIGEQKFNVPVDSTPMEMVYALAQEYRVPLVMHFQYEMFNTGYERLGKVLEKWPKVIFIAHAQTFWANVDANYKDDAKMLYPKGKIKAGGLSDRYLSDYANFYGDLSAGSGLNALTRDEDHARGFLDRHQDKLVYGSDCSDHAGFGPTCSGAGMISAIRRLSPNKTAERKMLFGNAAKMFKLS
jgi:predicted TIM-barrel fold metal-dependent hydrolase